MSVQLEVKERAIRPRSLRNQLRHEGKVPQSILKKKTYQKFYANMVLTPLLK